MRVKDLKITVEKTQPAANPKRDALQALPGAGGVKVLIETDEGISGSGGAFFGRIAGGPQALAALIEYELKPLVVGAEVAQVRRIHAALRRETEYHGTAGLATFGIAAIDTALWDCWGRALQVPCWQLWGGMHERIRAYAMVGWLNFSDAQVQKVCEQAVSQGFGAVKIKVGYPTLKEDVRRIETVRRVVGQDVEIMVDANQALTAAEAIRRGRVFGDMGVFWWEEPIAADDLVGYTALTAALDIPIATGENLYKPADFARFIQHGAVDIVQPDLRRAGGPTALLDIGALCTAFGKSYASHGGGPVQLNVMATLEQAFYLETGLIPPGSPLQLKDGWVQIPRGPGFSWA
jgi:L-alanine-DL-glutamate epimerase-like enolase superfamily enzyme